MVLVSSLSDVYAQKNGNSEMEIFDDYRGKPRNVLKAVHERDDSTDSIGTLHSKSRV